MPARSKAQAIAAAIAEHAPSKLYARNQGLANMTTQQQHDKANQNWESQQPDPGPVPAI